jgi:nucleoid-associated protein
MAGGLAMRVFHIVVHELKKEQHVTGAELITSDTVMPINDVAIALVSELNKRFQSHNSINAVFGNQNNPFPSGFNSYNQNRTEQVFMDFTRTSSDNLRTRIQSSAPAKGGYLVFADYENHGHFIAVFLIRNKAGMLFVRRGNRYILDTGIQHIDFENMAMACRINCDIYNNPTNQERYLRFTKKDSEDVSAYFTNWITMNNTESMKANTKNLYRTLKAIPKPIDKNGNIIEEDDFMHKAVDYIKEKKKEVNIRQLSLYLYADENTIHDYAAEQGIALDSTFRADSILLNRYLHVKVKADRFELKFPREYFNDKVIIHSDNQSIITIQSKELADKIKHLIQNNEI